MAILLNIGMNSSADSVDPDRLALEEPSDQNLHFLPLG